MSAAVADRVPLLETLSLCHKFPLSFRVPALSFSSHIETYAYDVFSFGASRRLACA